VSRPRRLARPGSAAIVRHGGTFAGALDPPPTQQPTGPALWRPRWGPPRRRPHARRRVAL